MPAYAVLPIIWLLEPEPTDDSEVSACKEILMADGIVVSWEAVPEAQAE